MSREWTEGNLAIVTRKSGLEYPAIYVLAPGIDYFWKPLVKAPGNELSDPVVDARPLVVIDPEDEPNGRGSTWRFLNDLSRHWVAAPDEFKLHGGTALIDWLRDHFSPPEPPKPVEPTGLGAVVEDAKGRLFVRAGNDGEFPWIKATDIYHANAYHWTEEGGLDDSHAVRVLSEGVTL